MKILHIITGLENGGAENTLYKVCKYDSVNKHIIISLTKKGKYFSYFKNLGMEVHCLNLKFYSIINIFRLVKIINFIRPDILQTWLIAGDLVGGITGKLAGVKNIVWNIHFSNLKMGSTKIRNLIIIKILAKLSYLIPKKIIVVSKNGLKNCKKLGYCKEKLIFIPNGYELRIFNSNKNLKYLFRKKFKIQKKIPILGNVSRFDPIKDHNTLLEALSIIRKKRDFLCILVGLNLNKKNKVLVNKIKELNLIKNIILLGPKNNIPKVMNGLDLHILTSISEAFPNVVVEAMACQTPCVATDVGDCSFIIGKTGWVVPPRNPIKLAKVLENALCEIGTQKWNKRKKHSRERIKENFDIDRMIKSLNNLWKVILNKNLKNII